MICPNCNAENELTWKRYWLSPLGRHTCTHCQAKFRMAHAAKYYISLIVVWFAIAVVAFYSAEYFNLNAALTYFIYLVIGSAITFPLDRKFDNTWRGTKPRH
jgi:uncharacterized membrane protein